ncbi:MAG: hypothetical protein M1838_001471 [Thelocarpon superellum]|nr:MAG: hypothetical protein M1838_001471 [Thelocarpon superellum]
MATAHPPLHYEASATTTNLQSSTTLPDEVVTCLKNARFLHLGTCDALSPHVSLMNYTYLPSSPYSPHPTIIMTTNPSSKKTLNLVHNPRVSLLVHDWVSHRPPTTSTVDVEPSPVPRRTQASRSSLASLLLNLNSSALSSISATINGLARIVPSGTEEEAYYRKVHLENNTFDDQAHEDHGQPGATHPTSDADDDGGRGCYIQGEEVQVVAVRVRDGRIADWKGGVRDWSVLDPGDAVPNGV